MRKLYIVVEKESLDSFESIKEALAGLENLAEFVVEERKVFCLTYTKKGDWEIEEVPLKGIAKEFLESVE